MIDNLYRIIVESLPDAIGGIIAAAVLTLLGALGLRYKRGDKTKTEPPGASASYRGLQHNAKMDMSAQSAPKNVQKKARGCIIIGPRAKIEAGIHHNVHSHNAHASGANEARIIISDGDADVSARSATDMDQEIDP